MTIDDQLQAETIWTFPVLFPGGPLELPKGAILTLQLEGAIPMLWAQINPTAPREVRNIFVVATGHKFVNLDNYIGTFQLEGVVWHVFEQDAPHGN